MPGAQREVAFPLCQQPVRRVIRVRGDLPVEVRPRLNVPRRIVGVALALPQRQRAPRAPPASEPRWTQARKQARDGLQEMFTEFKKGLNPGWHLFRCMGVPASYIKYPQPLQN